MNLPCRLLEMKKIKDTEVDCSPYGPRITAVLSYSKGFACALGFGTVYLFEKILEDSYKRSREIQVNHYYQSAIPVHIFIYHH